MYGTFLSTKRRISKYGSKNLNAAGHDNPKENLSRVWYDIRLVISAEFLHHGYAMLNV
jgi:hypothetical protein